MRNRSPDTESCIQACTACHDECTKMVHHCLSLGGAHAAPSHIGLMIDCAEVCHLAADFMLRSSEQHARACQLCSEVCDRCAQDCEGFDDDQMRRCAQTCRRCAESCREMAGAPA